VPVSEAGHGPETPREGVAGPWAAVAGPRQPCLPRPRGGLPGGRRGIRQFLDIGTGIPAVSNTHEVAQRAAPDARVVYVDNDPIVLRHAQALLSGTPGGATAYLHADLRDR
jgi:S-adenosyl methyltransferase